MIRIIKQEERLILGYVNYRHKPWVKKSLKDEYYKEKGIPIGKAFRFKTEDKAEDDFDKRVLERHFSDQAPEAIFILGKRKGDYYRIKSRVLETKNDVYLSIDMLIKHESFVTSQFTPIFPMIDNLISEPIAIGGKRKSSIPIEEYEALLKYFPTPTELQHYASSKIFMILKDYMETMTDAQKKFEKYLKKKEERGMQLFPKSQDEENVNELYKHEIEKYEYIKIRIEEELEAGKARSEAWWQNLMMNFVLLLFPKYIAVLENVMIKDFYSERGKIKNRYIDIALVDTSGNLDVIEIKKPFQNCLLAHPYRDNYTPKTELAGAIMQAEKYIFHLNKWGIKGEAKITLDHKDKLPAGMGIQITNPKAIIIIGRSKGLSKEQLFDLEVIRRKYSNIMDIITYDDLLERLDNIIKKFKDQSQP